MADKNRLKGDAAVAGTAGATFGAPIAIRSAENAVKPRMLRRVENQQRQVAQRIKPAPRPTTEVGMSTAPKTGTEHKVQRLASGETREAKAARIATNRSAYGELNRLGHTANKLSKPFYRHQSKLWGASLAAGLPATVAANRYRAKQVSKAYDKRKADAQVAGGFAAGAGYQGASLAVKPFEQRKYEAKIKRTPELKAIQQEHREKHLPANATAGHKGWKTYSRTYPKELPGARLRRVQAYTHAGGTGTAATVGAALTGAYVANRMYDRKVHKSRPYTPAQQRRANRISANIGTGTSIAGLATTGALAAGLAAPKLAGKGLLRKVPQAAAEGFSTKIKHGTMYTGIGLGGVSGAKGLYDAHRTRKENPIRKDLGDGLLDEGFAKAWSPVHGSPDPEKERMQRANHYQHGGEVLGGAGLTVSAGLAGHSVRTATRGTSRTVRTGNAVVDPSGKQAFMRDYKGPGKYVMRQVPALKDETKRVKSGIQDTKSFKNAGVAGKLKVLATHDTKYMARARRSAKGSAVAAGIGAAGLAAAHHINRQKNQSWKPYAD